jgi:hypothetical protein
MQELTGGFEVIGLHRRPESLHDLFAIHYFA